MDGTDRAEAELAGQVAPELRQVTPLAGRTIELGDLTVRLVSLEVWSNGFTLRFASGGPYVPGMWERLFGLRWSASDDTGTVYREYDGACGGPDWHTGHKSFRPAPPERARRLAVVIEEVIEGTAEGVGEGEGLRTTVRFGLTPRHPGVGPIAFRDR